MGCSEASLGASAGLGFRYIDFTHPTYRQDAPSFVAGLSVIDALFQLGWEGTAELVKNGQQIDHAM